MAEAPCRKWSVVVWSGLCVSVVLWIGLVVNWLYGADGIAGTSVAGDKLYLEYNLPTASKRVSTTPASSDMSHSDFTDFIVGVTPSQVGRPRTNTKTSSRDTEGGQDGGGARVGVIQSSALSKACLDAARANDTSQPRPRSPTFQMTHVINPFATTDVHFNFTLVSIAAAVRRARSDGISVQVLGITFDNEVLNLPPEVTAMPTLPGERSAGTYLQSIGVELGDGEKPLKTPVVKDVFLQAAQHADAPTVIWTNFDLILREDFYSVVHKQLQRKVGFSVLRLDLIIERLKHPDLASWSIDRLYQYKDTRAQGGHDCLVFPTRWLRCLDYRDFVFGVGGWGYAIFGELAYLSQVEGHGVGPTARGFSVLKPGVHIDNGGITRHIGSQNANPRRYYSNPVPWLGPLRRNQLMFNMRMKFDVELQLSLDRGGCKRQYFPAKPAATASACAMDTSSRPTGELPRCPEKRSGALQPVAVATAASDLGQRARPVLEALMLMAVGSIHVNRSLQHIASHPLVLTHAESVEVRPEGVWDAHTVPSKGHATTAPTRWGPTVWDAVVLLVDLDPGATVLRWLEEDGGVDPATAPAATMRKALGPLVERYKEYHNYWLRQHASGGVPVIAVNLAVASPRELAAELVLVAEVVAKAKLGSGNRWCRGAPAFNVCCAVRRARRMAVQASNVRAPPAVMAWLGEQLGPTHQRVLEVWRSSRRRSSASGIDDCCDAETFGNSSSHVEGEESQWPLASTTAAAGAVGVTLHSKTSLSRSRRGRVERALPGLFALLPSRFDTRFKAPCWLRDGDGGHARRLGPNRAVYSCVPSFFLLGQVKCGTTDMFSSLARHKQVMRTVKEQHWFSREWYKGDKYLSRFSFAESAANGMERSAIGDGTPDYIWAHLRCLNRQFKYPNDGTTVTIAEALAELNPAARLLLMLRDPVSRLLSDFFYFLHRRERDLPMPSEGDVNASHFHEYVRHGLAVVQKCLATGATMDVCVWTSRTMVFASPTRLVMGCYAPFVKEYLRNFDRAQLLVFELGEYHKDPQRVLSEAFDHIGVDPPSAAEWSDILSRPTHTKINQQGAQYKTLRMLPETRALLTEFYRPCTVELGRLLNTTRFERWLQV